MGWAKGQSGNPSGRPKGSGKLTTVLRERLDELQADGRTLAQHVTDALVSKALEGDTTALRMLYDRSEGRVSEPQSEREPDDYFLDLSCEREAL